MIIQERAAIWIENVLPVYKEWAWGGCQICKKGPWYLRCTYVHMCTYMCAHVHIYVHTLPLKSLFSLVLEFASFSLAMMWPTRMPFEPWREWPSPSGLLATTWQKQMLTRDCHPLTVYWHYSSGLRDIWATGRCGIMKTVNVSIGHVDNNILDFNSGTNWRTAATSSHSTGKPVPTSRPLHKLRWQDVKIVHYLKNVK